MLVMWCGGGKVCVVGYGGGVDVDGRGRNVQLWDKISPALPQATLACTGVNLVYWYLPGDNLPLHLHYTVRLLAIR